MRAGWPALLVCCLFASAVLAQTKGEEPTVKPATADSAAPAPAPKLKRHSPRFAAIASAVLPGAGQVYNRKYWKLPIIYGGAAAFGYLIATNYREYKLRRDAIVARTANPGQVPTDPYADQYSTEDLLVLSSDYRRNLEWSVLGAVLLYTLNIVDANVDAHLFHFDVSNDLSLHWQPSLTPQAAGVSLAFSF